MGSYQRSIKRYKPLIVILGLAILLPILIGGVQIAKQLFSKASEGGVTTSSGSGFGKAIHLGTTAYVEVTNPNTIVASKNFTAEAWIKPLVDSNKPNFFGFLFVLDGSNNTTYGSLAVSKIDSSGQPYQEEYTFGGIFCSAPDVTAVRKGLSFAQVTSWQHVALVIQPNGVANVFVNGLKLAEISPSNNVSNCNYPFNFVYIGGSKNATSNFFAGDIDEIRISNTARYTQNFTPLPFPFIKDPSTLLLYHFDGNLNDASGKNHTGTGFGNYSFIQSMSAIGPSPKNTIIPIPIVPPQN